MKRAILLLPLGIFLIVAVFLFRGLWLDPSELPSALIGKPFPAFDLPSVQDPARRLTEADLKGKPALVNVWGTWCPSCRVEHPELTRLAEQVLTSAGVSDAVTRAPDLVGLVDALLMYQAAGAAPVDTRAVLTAYLEGLD